jgi:hypothetical protein
MPKGIALAGPMRLIPPGNPAELRSLRIELTTGGLDPASLSAVVLVGPGARIGRVIGGAVLGCADLGGREPWTGEWLLSPAGPVGVGPTCGDGACAGPLWNSSDAVSCWRLIGGLAPDAVVRIEEMEVVEPTQVAIAIWGADPAAIAGSAEAIVTESGTLTAQRPPGEVGQHRLRFRAY